MKKRHRSVGSNKNPRTTDRWSWPLSRSASRGTARVGEASGLMEAAGRAPTFEALEARQLLFTATIDPSDPGFIPLGNGYGTVEAGFNYFLQSVSGGTLEDAQLVTVDEDFDEDNPAGPVPVNVPSGFKFNGSSLVINHTASSVVLEREVLNAPSPPNRLRASLQAGQSLTLVAGVQQGNATLLMDRLALDIGAPGWNLADITVELVLLGNVVQSFTGATLGAANVSAPGQGIGRFQFARTNGANFDGVRIVASGAVVNTFTMNNVQYDLPGNPYAAILNPLAGFGAIFRLTGPIGATMHFTDLYEQEMFRGNDYRLQQNGSFPGDPDADGVPNFNRGIGRVVLEGTDEFTTLSVIGGTMPPPTPVQGQYIAADGFRMVLPTNPRGLYDPMEAAGYGLGWTVQDTEVVAVGLPPGSGSVIIGAPNIRPDGVTPESTMPGQPGASLLGNYVDPKQGIFVNGGNMGSVWIHGMLFGVSKFAGSLRNFSVGSMMGSMSVAGDLGAMHVAGDAGVGVISIEELGGNATTPVARNTQGTLTVGRSLGTYHTGGQNRMQIQVQGNISDPVKAPPLAIANFFEREQTLDIDPGLQDGPRFMLRQMFLSTGYLLNQNANAGNLGVTASQAPIWGQGLLRNDSLQSAEWIGSLGTGVTIHGDVGANDPANAGDDPADVFAFASDGTTPIVVEVTGTLPSTYARLLDEAGRTVAALTVPSDTSLNVFRITYTPDRAGVYYLVMATADRDPPPGANPNFEFGYTATVLGMAPTMAGAIRSGLAMGGFNANATAIQVNGSLGLFAAGTGIVGSNNQFVDPQPLITNALDADLGLGTADIQSVNVGISGNLYAISSGANIAGTVATPALFVVGGHIGMITTGDRNIADRINSDLRNTTISAGGSIGSLLVRGGIGYDHVEDSAIFNLGVIDTVNITTGNDALLKGDIGLIRVSAHVAGGRMNIKTDNGARIGAVLVSQDVIEEPGTARSGIFFGNAPLNNNGINIVSGVGSDVRFLDTPRVDMLNQLNQFVALPLNVPVKFTDDGGAEVEITVVGTAGSGAGGLARVVPINGSKGVAIGRIEADLTGGARLRIRGLGAAGNKDVISIGRIIITNAGGTDGVRLEGPTQIDVWKIDFTTTGGGGLVAPHEIQNLTPGGDIVAIDATALDRIEITSGNLGKTEMPSWGVSRFGPFLGLAAGAGGAIGGAIGVGTAGNEIIGGWNGQIFRPIINVDDEAIFLDDIGFPADGWLDGAIIRTGNLLSARVGGAMGDVIVAGGDLIEATANLDGVVVPGVFQGLFGNLFATRISLVDVGDGMATINRSEPLVRSSIIARDDIFRVRADRLANANLTGIIAASNITPGNTAPNNFPTDGIDSISVSKGGDMRDLYIGAMSLDDFWDSFYSFDGGRYTGTIQNITGTDADLIGSRISAVRVVNVVLTNGFYDASQVRASDTMDRLEATGFRNSTIDGTFLEYRPNFVEVAGDIGIIKALQDISDIRIEAAERMNSISARNITRSLITADLVMASITADNIRGTEFQSGRLEVFTVKEDLRSSVVSISGPILGITVGDEITNSTIEAIGPDGRIDGITAKNQFSGKVVAAGPIELIEVTDGDLSIDLITTTPAGNVVLVKTGRDLDIRSDVAGSIDTLDAGRHIGNRAKPGVVLVRGDVKDVKAPNGQLYSDLRIGDSLTGSLLIGRAVNLPSNSNIGRGSILAFGRIERVDVLGDFAGSVISYSGGIGVVRIQDGSFLPGNLIAAYDGSVKTVNIIGGDLLGNVHADQVLEYIRLEGSADGVFGDVGINPGKSAGVGYDAFRNQLPPSVLATNAINGPRLTAGWNFGRIDVLNGSMFETFIYGGRAVGTVNVSEAIRGDGLTSGYTGSIAAGSTVFRVATGLGIEGVNVLAGVRDFGADGRAGGTGANTDVLSPGRVVHVEIGGVATNTTVTAGLNAGADGLYNTSDDTLVLGNSFVRNVSIGGNGAGFSVFSDRGITGTNSGNFTVGGVSAQHGDALIFPGGTVGTLVPSTGVATAFSFAGGSGTISFTGPGKVQWDAANGRMIASNTTADSSITINANGGTLNNFNVVTNDDASIGSLAINAVLTGNSNVVVDGYIVTFTTNGLNTTGRVSVGNNVRFFNAGQATNADISMVHSREFNASNVGSGVSSTALTGNFINITGNFAGVYNLERDLISSMTVGGVFSGRFRSGASVPKITAGSMDKARISINNTLGELVVNGTVDETQILAGGDLGSDATPGGSGLSADRETSGSVGKATIAGDFTKSSLIAGSLRGVDGFFGTIDDSTSGGRSTIGDVTIGGTQVGSNNFTEQYRISSTGGLGAVTIGGFSGQNQGNFKIESLPTLPRPIQVTHVRAQSEDSNTFVATVFFNQAMNSSTLGPALSIREVRSGGTVVLSPLTEGTDYTLEYDESINALRIFFSPTITSRDLPQQANVPGPGTYRIEFDSSVLRATVASALLDGNGDGFAVQGEDYADEHIIGDAGDRLAEETVIVPGFSPVDFYAPADMDLMLDSNTDPDGLPEINRVFTISGSVGDHPDEQPSVFDPAADVDLYKVTLQAGQILRLGAMGGPGLFANRFLVDSAGDEVTGNVVNGLELNFQRVAPTDITLPSAYLIKQTGVYYIVIDNSGNAYNATGEVVNDNTAAVGNYEFTVEVFDDGDSGFKGDTDAGNGQPVAYAPNPGVFAGNDGVLGTGDDLASFTVGEFVFVYDRGADGQVNTADDIVSGSNAKGVSSTRVGGKITSTIQSSIGTPGGTGVPGTELQPDVDIFHLNNGVPIAPGVRLTVTVKLADLGSNLGSRREGDIIGRFPGAVQFGVFDSTAATNATNGQLIFSPSDFGTTDRPTQTIAQNEATTYGYDANGNFFISFANPGRIGVANNAPAELSVYLQGVYRTDYILEVVQEGTGTNVKKTQNVLLETKGGVIDWLEVSGAKTSLQGFDPAVLGFTGSIQGQKVRDYIIKNTVTALNGIFGAAGLDVIVSDVPVTFENQPYAKVFVSNSADPVALLDGLAYGASEHSDALNADLEDEAVVFAPTMFNLDPTPDLAGVNAYVNQLAAAVGRRIGELMGLRLTALDFDSVPAQDTMSSSSVFFGGGGTALLSTSRALASPFDVQDDTEFFLGEQNAVSLLDKLIK